MVKSGWNHLGCGKRREEVREKNNNGAMEKEPKKDTEKE